MCGIIGYIGTKKAKPILINGLLRLEYRGYDSAGIATVEKDGIKVIKEKGRIANLDALYSLFKNRFEIFSSSSLKNVSVPSLLFAAQ